MDYLAYPKKTAQFVNIWGIHIDLEKCRAIVLKDTSTPGRFTMTTVSDLAAVVVEAVDYQGVWPEIGGIRGDHTTMVDLIHRCEKTRGN
jgi:hypothetical protein